MSRFYIFLIAVLLGACGFEPATKSFENKISPTTRVQFATPKTKDEFYLRGFFDEIFGQPKNAFYHVDYKLNITETKYTISTSEDVFRYDYEGIIDLTLKDNAGNILEKFSNRNSVSQISSGSIFGENAERTNAVKRLTRSLAELGSAWVIATVNHLN